MVRSSLYIFVSLVLNENSYHFLILSFDITIYLRRDTFITETVKDIHKNFISFNKYIY